MTFFNCNNEKSYSFKFGVIKCPFMLQDFKATTQKRALLKMHYNVRI